MDQAGMLDCSPETDGGQLIGLIAELDRQADRTHESSPRITVENALNIAFYTASGTELTTLVFPAGSLLIKRRDAYVLSDPGRVRTVRLRKSVNGYRRDGLEVSHRRTAHGAHRLTQRVGR